MGGLNRDSSNFPPIYLLDHNDINLPNFPNPKQKTPLLHCVPERLHLTLPDHCNIVTPISKTQMTLVFKHDKTLWPRKIAFLLSQHQWQAVKLIQTWHSYQSWYRKNLEKINENAALKEHQVRQSTILAITFCPSGLGVFPCTIWHADDFDSNSLYNRCRALKQTRLIYAATTGSCFVMRRLQETQTDHKRVMSIKICGILWHPDSLKYQVQTDSSKVY